jgi:hypothetical protein
MMRDHNGKAENFISLGAGVMGLTLVYGSRPTYSA